VPCYDHGGSGLVLYIGVATMFLTCCNWSSSWCNRFSFILQSLWTYCIRVLDMLRVFHVNVSKLDLNIFDAANINLRCCGCWVTMLQTRDVGCCKY
jgi:hypothetical protein